MTRRSTRRSAEENTNKSRRLTRKKWTRRSHNVVERKEPIHGRQLSAWVTFFFAAARTSSTFVNISPYGYRFSVVASTFFFSCFRYKQIRFPSSTTPKVTYFGNSFCNIPLDYALHCCYVEGYLVCQRTFACSTHTLCVCVSLNFFFFFRFCFVSEFPNKADSSDAD